MAATKSLDDFLPAEPKPERGKDDGDGADEPQGATIPPPQVDSVILSSPETPWEEAFGRPADVESKVAIEKYGFVPTSYLDFTNDDRWQLDIPREIMDAVEIKHGRGLADPGENNWHHSPFRASKFNSGLARFLIRYYTSPGDLVVDPYSGWGTRGYCCQLLGRRYIGFEVVKTTVDAVNKALETRRQMSLDGEPATPAIVYLADGVKMEGVPDGTVDDILTCPPYADREIYGEADPASGGFQLSRLDRGYFEQFMKKSIRRCHEVLKPGGLCIWVVNDWREDKKIYPFTYLLMQWAYDVGFDLHDFLVHRLRSVTAMGIGTFLKGRFVCKSHENVVVWKKPSPGG